MTAEPGFAGTRCGNTYVIVHAEGPSSPVVAELCRNLEILRKSHSDFVGLLVVVKRGTKPPESAERAAVARLMKEMRLVLSTAVVVGGAGFWAAAVRSAATFVATLSGHGAGVKVFAEAEEAAAWLEQQAAGKGATANASEIARVANSLRAQLGWQ